jgi:uncharacterized protein YkwD
VAAAAASGPSAAPPGGTLGAPVAQACELTAQEQQIADLMRHDPGQKRSSLNCNGILARVARARAEDMATRGYFSHTNPDGFGPNYLVRQAGHSLPAWWPTGNAENYIESIAAGLASPQATFQWWLGSSQHRQAILGETQFYADQTNYGIGYIAGGPRRYYWVVLTAPPPGS